MTLMMFNRQMTVPVDDECGHLVTVVSGEHQHHDIPDDGAPHAATSECGCGPQRYVVDGHIVFEHVDQDRIRYDDEDGWCASSC